MLICHRLQTGKIPLPVIGAAARIGWTSPHDVFYMCLNFPTLPDIEFSRTFAIIARGCQITKVQYLDVSIMEEEDEKGRPQQQGSMRRKGAIIIVPVGTVPWFTNSKSNGICYGTPPRDKSRNQPLVGVVVVVPKVGKRN